MEKWPWLFAHGRTPCPARRAHFLSTNNVNVGYPPDQGYWMDCAQSCISVCNWVTLSEEGSAAHCTYPVAGGKRPIDYKPFPTATTSVKASVLRFVALTLLSVPIALVAFASDLFPSVILLSCCLAFYLSFTDPLIGVISYESRYP